MTLSDDLLPEFDVSDAIGVVVGTDAATAWQALMEVDLVDLGRRHPILGALGGLRPLEARTPALAGSRR